MTQSVLLFEDLDVGDKFIIKGKKAVKTDMSEFKENYKYKEDQRDVATCASDEDRVIWLR